MLRIETEKLPGWVLGVSAGLSLFVSSCAAGKSDAETASASPAVILADTNRDGVVDDADRAGKTDWSMEGEALLLANIGDIAGRCPGPDQDSLSDNELEACHDASDDLPHAPEYFAPVLTLPIKGLSETATGNVTAMGAGKDKIRVFIKRDDVWTFLEPGASITSEELETGLTLGVDARDIVRDSSVWDGNVTLNFSVVDGDKSWTDSVAMRVAPVVVHNHLQRATEVYVPESGREVHETFVADLTEALGQFGFDKPLNVLQTTDTWAQDFVEFGYMSMPAPDGGQTMIRVAIRSPQPGRSAGRSLFALKGPGFGVVQTGGDAYHQVDSFGNLETIPPYEFNGKSYPAGRVIYGDAGDGYGPHKDFSTFFASQEIQAPIVLDTSWLIIAHVDEFVQFLPADNDYGWTIAVKDVASGLAVLREAQAAGHGGSQAYSYDGAPDLTIDDVLSDPAFLEDNELARRKVELNLQILLAETGLPASEVVRIPGLFEYADFADFLPHASVRDEAPVWPGDDVGPGESITYSQGNMAAFYPGAINGLLMDDTNYIPPKQWGPIIDGVDIMEAAVTEAYANAGITVWSIDDWWSHHDWGGEVHCGTNVTRAVNQGWWD